jgi:excisionase family DNA binding protein
MENENILERLTSIETLLKEQNRLQKEALSFSEACEYLEISSSHLYKLTSTDTIPHYKPNGKKIYFKRTEIDNWLLSNRSASKSEIEQQAANYLLKKGRVKL